ncbi:MAG: RNA polymerase subunit sigma-70 [Acidobacteria bacterium]|nr:MAG: RNA polymerase subunit sigma-70 [Acidobacteriota bacterium]
MSGSGQESTHRTIERVARESYGRLVAYLSSHTRDVASAEDALSNALVAALTTWPQDGVPQNPEAWLLTSARHSFIDLVRHRRVAEAREPTLLLLGEEPRAMTLSPEFPDERLKLLFVCAHPTIDPAMHTPLMLQTVLGLDAARIAHAFLVSPTTMGQRLVRAKMKIRDGGIQFEVPQERELPLRLDAVLEAIYAAFGIGWDEAGVDQRGRDLAEEAIWLARVLLQLMPREAEVRGLLALMLHCESRRPARRGPDGRYVPLSEQDPQQWSLPLIEEAERHLAEASSRGCTGRFQLEAAIQSVHAERARSGRTEWVAIMLFYEQLIRISPTLGTRTGYAAAVGEANGPEAGRAALDGIDLDAVSGYQPYWAVRAHLLQRLGKTSEAVDAFDRAIGLAEDPAVRQFLLQRRG